MKLPKFDYARPGSIGECCNLLNEKGPQALPVAGGTDLMIALKNWCKTPELLVDLQGVSALHRIAATQEGGISIGALVTLRELAENALVREKYPVLAKAALDVGSTQLQAMGTVGGNLCQDTCCLFYNRSPGLRQALGPCLKLDGPVCHAVRGSKNCWATYSGDLAPVLMVLKAAITVADPDGESRLPVEQLFSGDGRKPQTLVPGRLLTEVTLPAPPANSAAVYLKMRVRQSIDYPLLGVALQLALKNDKQTIDAVSLALTAVEKAPPAIAAAKELAGQILTDEKAEALAEAAFKKARPINNTYGYSPGYRKNMVRTYVKEALHRTFEAAAADGGAA